MNLATLIIMNTLGMAILVDAFKAAAHVIDSSAKMTKKPDHVYNESDCKASLAFVQGTGLDLIIQDYGIALDPDDLRSNFFTAFGRRDLID